MRSASSIAVGIGGLLRCLIRLTDHGAALLLAVSRNQGTTSQMRNITPLITLINTQSLEAISRNLLDESLAPAFLPEQHRLRAWLSFPIELQQATAGTIVDDIATLIGELCAVDMSKRRGATGKSHEPSDADRYEISSWVRETLLPALSANNSSLGFLRSALPRSADGFPHTVTFYSYKGGVGRTLALLNVAIVLARTGNRVAVFDFDLEAPGVDTFPGFNPPHSAQPGLVEFVRTYLQPASRRAPSIKEFIYEAKYANARPGWRDDGRIFVLRAGIQDDAYVRALHSLNWNELFVRNAGLRLFENAKAELLDEYGCNYILIDSRTGLTDIAGICTGLLPDTVVFVFYPDEQNLRGIQSVAQRIARFSMQHQLRIDRLYCPSRMRPTLEDIDAARNCALRLCEDIERYREPALVDLRRPALEGSHVNSSDFQESNWNYWTLEGWRTLLSDHAHGNHKCRTFPLAQLSLGGLIVGEIPGDAAWFYHGHNLFGGMPIVTIPEHRATPGQSLVAATGDLSLVEPFERIAAFCAAANINDRIAHEAFWSARNEAWSLLIGSQTDAWARAVADYQRKWIKEQLPLELT